MRPPRGGGGGFRGGRGFGGRGGRGGRGSGFRDEGPPDHVVEVASFLHACEGDAVTKININERVPFFNAPIYLQNKTQIGKVDEIFGPINEAHFSIKMREGIVATSYSLGDKFYIDPTKLLPLSRFLPQPKGQAAGGARGGGRGGGRGAFRGGGGFRGRGGPRGGRSGPPRGGGRGGGFRSRGRF